jgi:hypothetical protein
MASSKETDELKLTITELRERLLLVDRSISSLTHIVSDFMRDSFVTPRSSISSASLLYDGDPLAAGFSRHHDHTGMDSPDTG